MGSACNIWYKFSLMDMVTHLFSFFWLFDRFQRSLVKNYRIECYYYYYYYDYYYYHHYYYYYYYYFYSYHESGFLSQIYIKVNRLFTPVNSQVVEKLVSKMEFETF